MELISEGNDFAGEGRYNKKTQPTQDEPDPSQLGWKKKGGGERERKKERELQKHHLFQSFD
jgi:hypothetical protein